MPCYIGPLLFLIYVNDLIDYLPKDTQIVQYADDTMVFSSNKCLKVANGKVENAVNFLFKYFESNRLKLNCGKTELNIFCKKSKVVDTKNISMTVKDNVIQSKEAVKYLGIYLDQSFNFQEEVKNILRKMAMGIKTLNVIKHPFPVSTRILLMNALILSHLHYSSVVIQGI